MTRSHPLDPYLPLLNPEGDDALHVSPEEDSSLVDGSLPLLEVTDAALLVAVARDPRVCRFLLGRLSDTVALVDPGSEDDLLTALRAAGHTPKTVTVTGRTS